jgi:hypothetical protein
VGEYATDRPTMVFASSSSSLMPWPSGLLRPLLLLLPPMTMTTEAADYDE